MTLSQLLALDNTALSRGTTGFSTGDLFTVTEQADASFDEGNPSAYADEHLTTTNPNGGGTTPMPEPSSLLLLASELVVLGMAGYWRRRHGSAIAN